MAGQMYFLIKSIISFSFYTTAIPEILLSIVLNCIPKLLEFSLFTPKSVYDIHEMDFF